MKTDQSAWMSRLIQVFAACDVQRYIFSCLAHIHNTLISQCFVEKHFCEEMG